MGDNKYKAGRNLGPNDFDRRIPGESSPKRGAVTESAKFQIIIMPYDTIVLPERLRGVVACISLMKVKDGKEAELAQIDPDMLRTTINQAHDYVLKNGAHKKLSVLQGPTVSGKPFQLWIVEEGGVLEDIIRLGYKVLSPEEPATPTAPKKKRKSPKEPRR